MKRIATISPQATEIEVVSKVANIFWRPLSVLISTCVLGTTNTVVIGVNAVPYDPDGDCTDEVIWHIPIFHVGTFLDDSSLI